MTSSLSIYWGSIDADICGAGSQSCNNLNSVAITIDSYTLTGADLMALGALGKGNQFSSLDNQLVTISGLGPFTQVTLSTTGKCVRVQPWFWGSGTLDLGDDARRSRGPWPYRLSGEAEDRRTRIKAVAPGA